MHRALASLIEELEAVDWYAQRIEATGDDELRAVLTHSLDEEREHAAMTLEWIRRRDPAFDRALREHLFVEGAITGGHHANGTPAASSDGDLGIAGLQQEVTR